MFFLAIVSQKILQSFYVAEKAGEQGKKCKACAHSLFSMTWEVCFWKQESVWHLLRKLALWAPAKCLGAQQLSKNSDSKLPPTHSPPLKTGNLPTAWCHRRNLAASRAEYYGKQVTKEKSWRQVQEQDAALLGEALGK